MRWRPSSDVTDWAATHGHAFDEQRPKGNAANDPKASLDDLEWAHAIVFGCPTRFGNVPAQLEQLIDTAGGLWFQGKLANKVYAGFTSAMNAHGGQERAATPTASP